MSQRHAAGVPQRGPAGQVRNGECGMRNRERVFALRFRTPNSELRNSEGVVSGRQRRWAQFRVENRISDGLAKDAYTGRHLTFGRSWSGHRAGRILLRNPSSGRSVHRTGRAMGSRGRVGTGEPRTPVLWPRPWVSRCAGDAPDTRTPSCREYLPAGQARAKEMAAGMRRPPAVPRHHYPSRCDLA